MNQEKLIHLYNSMFDDADVESNDEIKDTQNDLSNHFATLYKNKEPELFSIIFKIFYHLSPYAPWFNKDKNFFIQEGLSKITGITNIWASSYFENFNPPNGDFSIIFRYLRNVKYLFYHSFAGCKNLKKINLPETIVNIENDAFIENKKLEQISLPKFLTEIPPRGFSSCESLKSITMPKNINLICNDAFKNCTSLKNIIFNESIEAIDERAFANCPALENIILPKSIKDIGTSAFESNLDKLKLLIIPKKLKSKIKFIFGETPNFLEGTRKIKIIYI